MLVILTLISIGHLLFGYVPESVTLLIFGIGMIGLAVGIRRILKHQEVSRKGKGKGEGV